MESLHAWQAAGHERGMPCRSAAPSDRRATTKTAPTDERDSAVPILLHLKTVSPALRVLHMHHAAPALPPSPRQCCKILLYAPLSTAVHICTYLGRSLELRPQLGQLCLQLSEVVFCCLQETFG